MGEVETSVAGDGRGAMEAGATGGDNMIDGENRGRRMRGKGRCWEGWWREGRSGTSRRKTMVWEVGGGGDKVGGRRDLSRRIWIQGLENSSVGG